MARPAFGVPACAQRRPPACGARAASRPSAQYARPPALVLPSQPPTATEQLLIRRRRRRSKQLGPRYLHRQPPLVVAPPPPSLPPAFLRPCLRFAFTVLPAPEFCSSRRIPSAAAVHPSSLSRRHRRRHLCTPPCQRSASLLLGRPALGIYTVQSRNTLAFLRLDATNKPCGCKRLARLGITIWSSVRGHNSHVNRNAYQTQEQYDRVYARHQR